MQTIEDRISTLEHRIATLALLLALTVTALLATIIIFGVAMDKQISLPAATHQGTK